MTFLLCLLCLAGTVQVSAKTVNVVTSAKTAANGKWVKTRNGVKYRYTKTGKAAKNVWLKIQGSIYRFDTKGYRRTGWFKFNGNRYYAGPAGKLYVRRWLKEDGKCYYLGADGTLARNRRVRSGGKYYYVNSAGVRLTKTWVKQNGKFYYYGASGALVTNRWVGDYYVGAGGARKTNCIVDGYYLDANGKKAYEVFAGKYIFVGDSRMVGMQMAVDPEDTMYIAKESMGYEWLVSTAGPQLKQSLKKNPNVTVVLAFGVNDLGNVNQYISYYQSLMKAYPETKFYVLSVNPVNESIAASHGYTIKNSQIVSVFNKPMKNAVGQNHFINTYRYLRKKGFAANDGLHYTIEEYANLYKYIIKKIK